jgi:hypothetical protein
LPEDDRWVRFHSLPEWKRHAESDAEYATILLRHHSVLDELGAAGRCYVISGSPTHTLVFVDEATGEKTYVNFANRPLPLEPEPIIAYLPGARLWGTYEYVQDDRHYDVYASQLNHPSQELDDFLLAVADDVVEEVIIGPPDLAWLYLPYDGGADVIASSSAERDRLRTKFAAWLPTDPAPADPLAGWKRARGSKLPPRSKTRQRRDPAAAPRWHARFALEARLPLGE